MNSKVSWVFEVKYLSGKDQLYPSTLIESFDHYPFVSRIKVFRSKHRAKQFLADAVSKFCSEFPEYRYKVSKTCFQMRPKLRRIKT